MGFNEQTIYLIVVGEFDTQCVLQAHTEKKVAANISSCLDHIFCSTLVWACQKQRERKSYTYDLQTEIRERIKEEIKEIGDWFSEKEKKVILDWSWNYCRLREVRLVTFDEE